MTPSPPATSLPASPHPVSRLAATAATTAVAAAAVHPAAAVAADARVALVVGATGLVGREILALLLADKTYTAVHQRPRQHRFCWGQSRSLPANLSGWCHVISLAVH